MNMVDEYLEALEKVIASADFRRVKKAGLASYYSEEYFPAGPIHLWVVDDIGVSRYFVFCEPSMALEVVNGSDHLSYWASPHEEFVLIDEASPTRMLETAERYINELKAEPTK